MIHNWNSVPTVLWDYFSMICLAYWLCFIKKILTNSHGFVKIPTYEYRLTLWRYFRVIRPVCYVRDLFRTGSCLSGRNLCVAIMRLLMIRILIARIFTLNSPDAGSRSASKFSSFLIYAWSVLINAFAKSEMLQLMSLLALMNEIAATDIAKRCLRFKNNNV